jgi:hypothetical protein
MPDDKTQQRLAIKRLIEVGDLPHAVGTVLLPAPTPNNLAPALTVSEGPCGNAGTWCADGPMTALVGWRRKLCDSCYRMWRDTVLGL